MFKGVSKANPHTHDYQYYFKHIGSCNKKPPLCATFLCDGQYYLGANPRVDAHYQGHGREISAGGGGARNRRDP
jgi:hypothetical protein